MKKYWLATNLSVKYRDKKQTAVEEVIAYKYKR
jgi:hypothetical protein